MEQLEEGVDYTIERRYGYAHVTYRLVALTAKAQEMTNHDAAVIADSIYPAFGGRGITSIGNVYMGVVHTD